MSLNIKIYQYKNLRISFLNYFDVLKALSNSAFASKGLFEYYLFN